MKIPLKNGTVVECNIEEFKELKAMGMIALPDEQPQQDYSTTNAAEPATPEHNTPEETKTSFADFVNEMKPKGVKEYTPKKRREWTEPEMRKLIELYNTGMSYDTMASHFTDRSSGSTHNCVYRLIKAGVLEPRETGIIARKKLLKQLKKEYTGHNTPEPAPSTPKHDDNSRRWKQWSEHEISTLRSLVDAGKNIYDLERALPGRNRRAIMTKRWELYNKNKEPRAPTKRETKRPLQMTKEEKTTRKEKMRERMKNEWTKDELMTLTSMTNNESPFADIKAALPNRTEDSIRNRQTRLRRKGLIVKKQPVIKKEKVVIVKEKPASEPEPKKEDGRVKRMKFVQDRAKHLVAKYGWSFEKARNQACEDWNNHGGFDSTKKKQQKLPRAKPKIVLKDLEFPDFSMVDRNYLRYVEDMVRNIIANKSKIGMRDMFQIMNSDGTFEWSGYMWRSFISEFMGLSEKIAKCFAVENKFHVERDSKDYPIIKYN